MTFDEMMWHCRDGGKARRNSWTSNARVFIEGIRLGVQMTSENDVVRTREYTATLQDKQANDWEIA